MKLRDAAEPTIVARYNPLRLDAPGSAIVDWTWALIVVAPSVRHLAGATPLVGRVLTFDWPRGAPMPTTREAVREVLRRRPSS